MNFKKFKKFFLILLSVLLFLVFLASIAISSFSDVVDVESVRGYESAAQTEISSSIPYFRIAEIAYEEQELFRGIIIYTGVAVALLIIYFLIKPVMTHFKKRFKNKRSEILSDIKEDSNQEHKMP